MPPPARDPRPVLRGLRGGRGRSRSSGGRGAPPRAGANGGPEVAAERKLPRAAAASPAGGDGFRVVVPSAQRRAFPPFPSAPSSSRPAGRGWTASRPPPHLAAGPGAVSREVGWGQGAAGGRAGRRWARYRRSPAHGQAGS